MDGKFNISSILRAEKLVPLRAYFLARPACVFQTKGDALLTHDRSSVLKLRFEKKKMKKQ